MTKNVDWKSNDGAGKDVNTKKVEYLKMNVGSTYKIRPIGEAIECEKYIHSRPGPNGQTIWRSVVCSDSANCPIGKKYGIKPQKRWMFNVIDRFDNRIKVYEFPYSIYNEFKKVYNITKKDIGGPNGGDFEIKVHHNGKSKKYDINYITETPFYGFDEAKMKVINERMYDLNELCKSVPPEEMEKILFGNGTQTSTVSSAAPVTTATPSSPVSSAPVADNSVPASSGESNDIPF